MKREAMDDLISRKAAIDTLDFCKEVLNRALDMGVVGNEREKFEWGIDLIETYIFDMKKLPSAQPEIIRCKECRFFEYNKTYVIQGIPVLGHEVCSAWGDGCKTDENGYCFMAERRADDDELHHQF